MLIWIVLYINEAMFKPIIGDGRDLLQYLSYIELIVELFCILWEIGLLAIYIFKRLKGKE